MVSIKKKETLKKTIEMIGEYPVIGIIDMHKLPAKQLHEIRNKIRDEAVIKMIKKRLMFLAFKEKKMSALGELITGEPALLFTKTDPFKLARVISKSKTKKPPKGGDISPEDIVVKAGPTNLPPGPVIGEFQRLKIPATVEGEKIAIKKDTVVVKKGEEISKPLADMLSKLDIQPMEIGLNLVAAWEKGVIYKKDVLFVPTEKYVEDIQKAHSQAFNLSINIGYVTKENVPFLLSKAHREALALAETAGIPTKETIGKLLKKGQDQAKVLGPKIKTEEPKQPLEKAAPKNEEKKEEKPKEESEKKEE